MVKVGNSYGADNPRTRLRKALRIARYNRALDTSSEALLLLPLISR